MIEQMFVPSDTDTKPVRWKDVATKPDTPRKPPRAPKPDTPRKPPRAPRDTKTDMPDPLSSRISWWPQDKAPRAVVAMIDKLWSVRDARIRWWFGVCTVHANPNGFPRFINYMRQVKIGPYWWGLAFQKEHTRFQISDATAEQLAELESAA